MDRELLTFQTEEGFGFPTLSQIFLSAGRQGAGHADEAGLFPAEAGLFELFPDFFSAEALVNTPPLYPDHPGIGYLAIDAIRQGIKRRVAELLISLEEVWYDRGGRRLKYADLENPGRDSDVFAVGFVASGPRRVDETKYYVSPDPEEIPIDDRRGLLNAFQANNRETLGNILAFQQDQPQGVEDFTPTIRTDSEYFTNLADIFRGYGQALTPEQGTTREFFRERNGFSPYFIRPVADHDEDAVGSLFQYNQIYGHAQRFFYEYLFNKYDNYRLDQVGILEEKNQLEKLINRNE